MTSGAWAITPDVAHRRLQALSIAGLRDVSFSTGTNHAAFVPVERVINGATVAAELGLDVSISIEVFQGSTFDPASVTAHPDIAPLIRRGRIRIFDRPWIARADEPQGTGPTHDARYSRFKPTRISGCPFALDELTVTPTLDLAACCGHPIDFIPDLVIGSVAQMTLAEALQAAPDNPLLEMLRVYGPERMFRIAKSANGAVRLPLDSAHACHTCSLLHREPEVVRSLREIGRIAQRQIAAEFDTVAGNA